MAATGIPECRLVELRARAREAERAGGRFVDPVVARRCGEVLDRRGEVWAAGVLGRDIARRSAAVPGRPYLVGGEYRVIVAADAEEDTVALAELDRDLR